MNCPEFEQIVTELARGPDERSSGRDAVVMMRFATLSSTCIGTRFRR